MMRLQAVNVLKSLTATVACALLVAGVRATEMYEWVDAAGLTHVSDVVPPEFQKTAKRIDSRQFEPSATDKQAADQRAATLKAQSEQTDKRLEAAAARRADAASAAARDVAANAAKNNKEQECAELWRKFHEGQTCFMARSRRDGSMRPLRACDPEIQDPTAKCGPERP